MGMPNLDPLKYLFTVPVGAFAGAVVSIGLVAAGKPLWWSIPSIGVGIWAGVKWGDQL